MFRVGNGDKATRLVIPLLLLLAIGGWYWLSQSVAPAPAVATLATATQPGATPLRATAIAEQPAAASTAAPQGLIGQATPWGAAGLEPTATATVAVVAPGAIALYGPPAGSRFGAGDAVSFYWSWPDALAEGQRFVLYLVSGDERQPLGQVDETNLGRAYQLRVLVEETGEFRWEVVLEDAATGATIGASENRAISIMGS